MARLPVPGSDSGTWGALLNDYLQVSLKNDGTIKDDAVTASQVQDGSLTGSSLQDSTITPIKLDAIDSPSNGEVLAYNNAQFEWVAQSGGSVPDASTTTKGVVQLAGDLGGTGTTAAAPVIADNAITNAKVSSTANIAQSKISGLTTDLSNKQPLDGDLTTIANLAPANDDIIQRKAGAWTNRTPAQLKIDLSLTKTDVGLANVDNTSDASKPVSTATQTALDGKANDGSVVHLSGVETITGDKDFTGALTYNGAGVATSNDIAGRQPLDSDLTAIAGLTPSDNDLLQRKAGAWTNRTPSQLKTDLSLTKSDVGLANVDNTSDASKPISTATQTALDGKVALAGANVTTLANSTTQFLRVNIPDDGSPTSSWPDRIANYFAGTRTGYFNEYGEVRARPGKTSTVALRAMGHASGSSGDIFQVANTDSSTVYMGVSSSQVTVGVPTVSTQNITAPNIGVKVSTGTVAPTSPAVGDIWVDTN